MINYIVVFAGGGSGSVARFMLATWIGLRRGKSFPLGTFVINISGSFLMGFLMTLMAGRFLANPQWRLILVVGGPGRVHHFFTMPA